MKFCGAITKSYNLRSIFILHDNNCTKWRNEDGSQIIRFGNGTTKLHDLPDLKQEIYSAQKSKYHEKEELLEL